MTEPAYRYALYDLLTREHLAEHIPFNVQDYSRMLDEAGTITASLNVTDARNQRLRPWERILPRRTTLAVCRDDVVQAEYLIWTLPPYKASEGRLNLRASEIRSYPAHRLLRPTAGLGSAKTLAFTQVDQLEIFRDLIDDMQSVTHQGLPVGDIGIELGGETSGVLRDSRDTADTSSAFHGYEFKAYSEWLDELAALENGFEWRIDSSLDQARQLRRLLRLGYPHLGRAADADSLTLEYPGNIIDYEWPLDGESSATAVFALGAGEELAMKWAEAYSPELLAGYPLLETTTSYKSVSVQATLTAHAQADVASMDGDITVPSLEVMGRPPVEPGDYVRLRITDEARFPGSIRQPMEVWVRCIGLKTVPGPPEKTTLIIEEPRTDG